MIYGSGLPQTAGSCTSLFCDRVRNEATRRAWRVAMVIQPDDAEFYANLARGAISLETWVADASMR